MDYTSTVQPQQGSTAVEIHSQEQTATRDSNGDSRGQPPPACRRCRKQKLRCTREQPACKRCLNISAICSYPPPPDRKLLAAQRAQDARARARTRRELETAGGPLPALQRKLSSDAFSRGSEGSSPQLLRCNAESPIQFAVPEHWEWERRSTPRDSGTSASPRDGIACQVPMPSTKVGQVLIDLYFSHVYNAALLFHEESFRSDYLGDRVPTFLALSVFAIASIFLRNSPKRSPKDDVRADPETLTLAIAVCNRHAHEWATAASQQVLSQADEPRLENIQACQNLALYWFSMDQIDRTDIHAHIAYRTSRLLGFHIPPERATEIDEVYGELKRRCFWSCWIMGCISQDNTSFKGRSWQSVVGLAFPSDEESFANGEPNSTQAFSKEGTVVSLTESRLSPQLSIMGELVKLYGLWWEIQHFVNQQNSTTAPSRIATLSILDGQLESFVQNLHQDFQDQSPLFLSASKTGPYNVFFLHCFYHLCACVLHSSIVPVFSNAARDKSISDKLIKLSTREAITHSTIIFDMSTAFLRNYLDISRLPSMIGYAMFVATMVQFKSLAAQGKLRTHGTGRFKDAICILEELKEYWRPLRAMWTKLESIFRASGINLNALSSNDAKFTQSSSNDTTIDVDKIATQKAALNSSEAADIFNYVNESEPKRPVSHLQTHGNSHHNPSIKSSTNQNGAVSTLNISQKTRLPVREARRPSSSTTDYHPRADHLTSQESSSSYTDPSLPRRPSYSQQQDHQDFPMLSNTDTIPLPTNTNTFPPPDIQYQQQHHPEIPLHNNNNNPPFNSLPALHTTPQSTRTDYDPAFLEMTIFNGPTSWWDHSFDVTHLELESGSAPHASGSDGSGSGFMFSGVGGFASDVGAGYFFPMGG